MSLICCPKLNLPDAADWPAVAAVFSAVPALPLQQAWLAAPEPDFRPGEVRLGWRNDALLVYAVLKDCDIYNDEREFNQPSFLRGDVFEIFLQPAGQEAYYEFHFSPHNQKLQLRWPSVSAVDAFREHPGENLAGLEPFKFRRPEIQSRTCIECGRWQVLAEIPFAMISESVSLGGDTRWKFSFSRYDHTRTRSNPVLSSTSPHPECNFHRLEEWGELVFEHLDSLIHPVHCAVCAPS
jgi:hypothetical protein